MGVNENDFDGRGVKSYDLSLQFPRDQDSNYLKIPKNYLQTLKNLKTKSRMMPLKIARSGLTRKIHSNRLTCLTPMLKYQRPETQSG